MYHLVDFRTKEKVTPKNLVFTGQDSPWEVVMDPKHIRSRINLDFLRTSPPHMAKYLPFMPISDYKDFVSLGEGGTPLIKSTTLGPELGIELFYKLENQNPTGSFKDRGSATEITVAKELGASGIAVASTGNMAASCSCYAAAAQIPCFVFVPEDTPQSKLAQVIAYGGRIVQVKGSYGDAARLAQEVAEKLGFYLAGDYAFRVEGHKTAAFELIEQLYFRSPHKILVPMGCGTNMASYYRGLKEYQDIGIMGRMPQLIGTQAAGAPTIAQAIAEGKEDSVRLKRVNSIARAIAINHALDGRKAIHAITATNGAAYTLSDTEMLQAQYRLSKEEGIFVETACASTLAALFKMKENNELTAGERVVCILTGSGLKDPQAILRIAVKPPTILPEVSEFDRLYQRKYFEGKNVTFRNPDEVIFTSIPSVESISAKVVELFETSYSETHISSIRNIVEKFLKKGKPISFSDFQDIVQEALETFKKTSTAVFVVEDFEVTAGRNKQAKARVDIRFNQEKQSAEAQGVGPVDALINALQVACEGKITFSLASYSVVTRSKGTDAVVFVELKLSNERQISVGTGTSPDVIQASIEAFEEAYNAFYSGDSPQNKSV